MEFTRTSIHDVVLCQPKVVDDSRGFFSETFRSDQFNRFLGFKFKPCQENESRSSFGVLRGLHYQLHPFAQSKLVRVTAGKVWDVAVDVRKGSPDFGRAVNMELSAENKRQLFIPRGFAHGFVVLSDWAIFSYKVDNYYNPMYDRGIAFDDKTLGIDWQLPVDKLILSQKDAFQPLIKDAELFEYGINMYV